MKSTFNSKITNTFSIDVRAKEQLWYDSVEELREQLPRLQTESLLHVGSGSNLLFTHNFDGVILHSRIRGMEVVGREDDYVLVRVGAGVVWDEFVAEAIHRGWYGAENLSFIPGEVGASAVQNIGAYGVEAKDLIEQVECVDLQSGELRVFSRADCRYDYRQSIFKQELRGRYAVTHVLYRLATFFIPHLDYGNISSFLQGDADVTADLVRQAVIRIRKTKLPDPAVMGNAGSFFVNPVISEEQFSQLKLQYPAIPSYPVKEGVKVPAGWLIEQAGWKGRALGPASVHDRQALVLVNRGGASGADILRLSDAVCTAVLQKFGIGIHPEVNVID